MEKVTVAVDGGAATEITGSFADTIWTGEYTVENEKDYTFTVTYAQKVLSGNASGTVYVNGYDSDSKKANLKKNSLTEMLFFI